MAEPAISTSIVPPSPSPPRASRRWTRWLARCAMMLAGLGLGAAIAECAFARRDGGAFPHLNVYIADRELGVRLMPGASEDVAFGGNPTTHIQINRDGFRGDELPAPGGDEVLVVGDSQVFGLGVEQGETFSARLAHAIGRTVVNAGVPTYGPAEYRAMIAEQLAKRHPKTVVLTINLANDLFEVDRPNRDRHAVWDGWAVRRELAPGSVTAFPGRELLFRRSHMFFALRKWRHGNPESADATAVASEGTWRDIVKTGERVETERRAVDQARRERITAVTEAHRAIERAERELDVRLQRELPPDAPSGFNDAEFSLALARANPGDIVGNPFAEASRSSLATADQIARAAAVRARLRDQLARWARTNQSADAKATQAQLTASDQAIARLTELDVQRLQVALDPPLAGYLRDVAQLVERGGARLIVVILPLDVQVSPAEWRKYGAQPVDMAASLALTGELVAAGRALGATTLDATPVLAAAEPGAFLDKDIHMTPKGHAAVAAALAAALREPPPRRAVASERSAVPLPDVFKRAPEVIVTGSSDAGCETKQVREWLRIQCARSRDTEPVDLEITRDDGGEALALVMPRAVSLVVPVVEGRELTATVTWRDRTRVLRVAWPAGAAKPTLAFDRSMTRPADSPRHPAERSIKDGGDPSGYVSPVERAICDCWRRVFGGGTEYPSFGRSFATCSGAYGTADPACTKKYTGAAACPELLACIRRDPASPP